GDPPDVARRLDGCAAEGDRGVALHVEEVRAAQMGVAALVAGAHAGRVDRHLDPRLLGDGLDVDLPADAGEATADLGDHHVAGDELHARVRRVDVVHAG